MALQVVPIDSFNEREHRTAIATATNELIKVRPPNDRTLAEVTASVMPLDLGYAPGDVRRYGDIDDAAAWTAAEAQFNSGGPRVLQLPIYITYFGGVPNASGTDNTPALNAAVDVCEALGYREIIFPGGDNSWYFNTQPDAIPAGITLRGENPRSFLIRNYNAGSSTEPFIEWDGSISGGGDPAKGGGLQQLGLLAGTSTTLGIALSIVGADTTNRPGYLVFRDVVISGNGSWSYGVRINGSNITTAGSQGQRDIHLSNIYIFRCATAHFQSTNGVHVYANSLGIFDGGLGGTVLAHITGGGSGTSNSNDVHISNLDCAGSMTIQDCLNVTVVGRVAGTLTIASSATNVAFMGTSNTLSNSSNSSVVIDSNGGIQTSNGLKLRNSSIVDFSAAVSASATAGGGGALPATPTGYLNVKVDGGDKRVPYYNT